MSADIILEIKSDMGPQDALATCDICKEHLAREGAVTVTFDKPEPNIFALQIALASQKSLLRAGRFAGFGPMAEQWLGQYLPAGAEGEPRHV